MRVAAADGVAAGSCRIYDLESPIGAASTCGLAQVLERDRARSNESGG
jgi:hypothetical protein